ncbi:MAG TPA: hypothetical protein DDZ68_16670 [Parvularcula sp.]|nr:hypothetical protein [Parvularcula sp.]HBS36708.1 hypothetical protein [Parvularcula sp.]
MTYDPFGDKVLWICAAVASAGVALAVVPAPTLRIDPFPPKSPAAVDLAAPVNLDLLAVMFDHSDLPAALPPAVPPPDPAADLKRFRFAGSASDGRTVTALFEAGGVVQLVKKGEMLAGFVLSEIESARAVFVKDDIEVVLPLGAQ